MSLVGPRPIVREELVHYGGQSRWYLAVRPGVTGPWQVGGRSDTSYATRVRLDVQYARNPSLGRDLRILLKTRAALPELQGRLLARPRRALGGPERQHPPQRAYCAARAAALAGPAPMRRADAPVSAAPHPEIPRSWPTP